MDARMFFVVPLAFFCEFVDSSLGMGYGTTLTPILLLMGFTPLQIVPAVLFSEFITGLSAAFFHHTARNVTFSKTSKDTKVAIVLAAFSGIGTVAAVLIAIRLPAKVMTLWIGVIVFLMGIVILATYRRKPRFTWRKIVVLGTVASFNKGLSGGGYGPLVMGGQILSGIGVRNAVGITSLAEGLTCLIGVLLYFFLGKHVDWALAPWLVSGAVLSVPLAAHMVKKVPERSMKFFIAITMLLLGWLSISKAFM